MRPRATLHTPSASVVLILNIAISAPPVLAGGGPDGFGYCWESSRTPADSVRFSWIEPTNHTPIVSWNPDPDDGWTEVALPLGFPFYGETLTRIFVCTNGFLQFPTNYTTHRNTTLPAGPFPFLIALFWDDLSLAQSGTVYLQTDSTAGYTVFTWQNTVRYNTSETLSCQALLFRDGRIRFNYLRVPATSSSSTVGIQGHYGNSGNWLEYLANGRPPNRVLTDSTSVVFYVRQLDHDVGVSTIRSPVGWIPARAQVPVVAVVKNYGRAAETFPVRALLIHSRYPYDTVFDRSLAVIGLAAGETAMCYFGDLLTGPVPDSWCAFAFTCLANDQYRQNDTVRTLTSSFPPEFGASLMSWELTELGDGWNLAGITFSPQLNRFYVALSMPNRVASFPVSGPQDSIRHEDFELQEFFTDEIIWGITWDKTSSSFWMTHVGFRESCRRRPIPKAALGTGCILARYASDGTFTGDTWDISNVEPDAWFAGIDQAPDGSLWATEVGGHNRIYRLDPRTKTIQGFLPGPVAPYRACAHLGDSTCFLFSGGWNDHNLVALSSTGSVVQSAALPDLADLDIKHDSVSQAESLLWAYVTRNDEWNTIERVSLGRTWAGIGLFEPPQPAIADERFETYLIVPNPARDYRVRLRCPQTQANVSLFNATGRLVGRYCVDGPGELALVDRDGHRIPAGVYSVRVTFISQTSQLPLSRTCRLVILGQ